jgi:RNA polymerase sigma-70 factor (ECF subfamily)
LQSGGTFPLLPDIVLVARLSHSHPGGVLSQSDFERRFNALLDAHGRSLGRVAGIYARDAAEREDLFQEIVVAIWRALPRFRGECSERTFVFRIAHNRGITHIARRRLPTTALTSDLELVDANPSPEQTLADQQQHGRLLDAVQRLSIGYRQVVTMVLEGMTYGEIADVLGITESNVGARLTRARQLLRNLL